MDVKELQQRAATLRSRTAEGSITPEDVGGLFVHHHAHRRARQGDGHGRRTAVGTRRDDNDAQRSDGRQRPTRRVYTVRISTDAGDGSLASWSVLELPNLREEMRKFLGL